VRAGSQAVIVSTSGGDWIVRDVSEGIDAPAGFQIYTAGASDLVDVPERPDGFALTSDGALFHLNDAEQFQAFWRATHDELQPLDLARLMSTYLSESAGHETIVMEAGALGIEDTRHPSIPPDVAKNGPLMMRFVTQYFVEEPPSHVARRHLVEWSVREDESGQLDWFWTPLSLNDV